MNASTNADESSKRIDMLEFPPVSTPDYCPFSVEVEPSNSHSFDHLKLSTVNKSWSLAMRTTMSGNLLDKGDSEDKEEADADDEFPLNQVDADIERALSNVKVPVGLVPISSDSESSTRDDSVDIDSDDEEAAAILSVPPPTPGAGSRQRHLPCDLSPRLSRTPARGEFGETVPPNPLNPLKVLNPGVPQGHASHRHHKRHNSKSRIAVTPQRGDSNALVTSNSNVGSTLAADCMCFAIEDVTQFFCPATPKSTTIDTTTQCPPGIDCFPAYDYGVTASPSALGGSFPGFWTKSSPLPRSREEQLEALFLMNANLPRNRSHGERRKHVRKLLAVWHGSEGLDTDKFGSLDDFYVVDKRQRRRKRNSVKQPKCCYDSDPEQEVLGRAQRRSALLSSKRRAKPYKPASDEEEPQLLEEDDQKKQGFRKFCPEPFTHLDTDEESTSTDGESSYETAKCNSEPSHPEPTPPAAPRNSDPKMSFDFGKSFASVDVDGATEVSEETKGEDPASSRPNGIGHRRQQSTTSLSTTGHSRFHTIRISPEQVQEGSVSSEASSDGYSSVSGSTALNSVHKGGNKPQQHALPSYFQSYPTHWTEFQLLFSRNVDEESVKSHVHELSNVRFPLVWHPRASSPSKATGEAKSMASDSSKMHCPTSVKIASLSSNANKEKSSNRKGTPFPISVDGCFEVGAHLEHMVVQPKFTWTPLVQPEQLSDDPESNHREIFLSGSAPPQVELLSIIRVNKAGAKKLDKNLYPYARPDRTCIVTTNDANHPTIVLEARSTQERDWLVFALKLIVARLASIIITRDEDMLHEFFSPYSALMRLEEEEESCALDGSSKTLPQNPGQENPNVECASTPTASSTKAVVVMDGDGSSNFVNSDDDEDDDSSGSANEDELSDDDLDDHIDGADQDRDDREIEDSIRARNAGAYAILKRSLSATAPFVDCEAPHEEHMPRTFSY